MTRRSNNSIAIRFLIRIGTSNLGDDRLPEHIERTIRHHVGDHPTLCRDVLEVFASTTPSVVRRLAARATFWELVTAIANRQPLLLVINEIARDPIEWLLIERIIYTSSAPILVVATPVAPTWQPCESERRIRQDEQTVLLEPQRLTFEQATYVLDSYIRLVPTLRQAWGEFATRDLSLAIDVVIDGASMGAIEPTESGYRLIAGLEMPTTVQAAADMRMAALSRRHTTAKRALTVAALLGRYVESKPWRRAMKQLGVTLETSAVEVLIRYRLLRRVRDGYRFSSESDRLAVLTHLTRDDAHVLLKTLPTDGVHWDLARAMVHLRLGEPEHAAQTLLGIELEMLRDSNTQADRWLNISHTIVDQLPPGHDLSNWTRVVSVRCLRGKNPQLRIAFVTKNLGELPDTADRNVVWELQSEKSIALCHLGRLEEAATIADALIEEPELGDRLRAEALATRGWVELNIGTLDKAFVMLNEAVDRHVALGHYGPAAVAAQYAALAVKDFDTVDAQFDRALRYASLAHDVTKYVPVLLERSMDHLYNERVEQIDRDSKIAYRLGSWGTPLMRVAFGANRAICLASLGKAKRAERVLRDTETIWHPDDHTGRTQLDGTRAVLAAIVGDTKRWDELMAHPLAPPIPNILQLLSVRHWERHGDERRAEEARSHFTD